MADGVELNLIAIAKQFSDEEAAWLFVERVRWPNGSVCLHGGSVDHATYLQPKDGTRKTPRGNRSYRRW